MPCSFKVASSSHHKDKVYRLRHQVFVEEEKRFDYPARKIFDEFDTLDETFSIIAECRHTPVGTIRVTLDNPVGLPPLGYYDFKPFMSRQNGKFAGISWLCISGKYRAYRGLLPGLFKTMVREVRKKGVRHVIAALHPGVLPLLKHYGAKQLDDVFHSEELNVPMVPIHVDLENLPPGVREIAQDPLNVFFDDTNERRIYKKGEVLTNQGDNGNEAFLIMRGSVQVLLSPSAAPGQDCLTTPLLGPGQLFGELALLDGGPRTATVVCHSREVDVMIYTRDEFLRQLRKDHSRAYEICRILVSRFRYLLEGTEDIRPQDILIARILIDASRKGHRQVEIKFLANQCGLWVKEIKSVLRNWQRTKIIEFDGEDFIRLADFEKLKRITFGIQSM